MIYLDNAASTRMFDKVIDYEKAIEKNAFANPSALHSFGMKSENYVNKAREIFAKEFNCQTNEIFFTKGATESNNIIVSSFASSDSEAVTSSIEHSSIVDSFKNNKYKKVIQLKNDKYGFIDLKALSASLNENTKIVSIIYVNNEIGTIQNIKKIGKIIKEFNKNIIFHIDATQALCKVNCNVKELNVDAMSFSGHKIHGPKGVGGLFVSGKIISKLSPVLFGGRQEKVSSGTTNVPAIYAMAKALEEMNKANEYEYIKKLNLYLREKVEERIEDIYITSPEYDCSNYILNICFAKIKAEVLLHMLEDKEIYVSSGSACSKGVDNRILKSLGVDDKYIDGSIRFSFSSEITSSDLDKVVDVLEDSIKTIRKVM